MRAPYGRRGLPLWRMMRRFAVDAEESDAHVSQKKQKKKEKEIEKESDDEEERLFCLDISEFDFFCSVSTKARIIASL